jgi:hypothetical protein
MWSVILICIKSFQNNKTNILCWKDNIAILCQIFVGWIHLVQDDLVVGTCEQGK